MALLAAADAQDVGLIRQVVMRVLTPVGVGVVAHITMQIIMAVMVDQVLLFLNMRLITVSH